MGNQSSTPQRASSILKNVSSNSSKVSAALLRKLTAPATGSSALPEIDENEDNDARQFLGYQTTNTLQWLSQNKPIITEIKILIRPVSFNNENYQSLGRTTGICHAFVIAQYGKGTILFERLTQGVRVHLLNELDLETEVGDSVFVGIYQVNLKGENLVTFAENQLKTHYSLSTNNCIHFAFQLGRTFLTEKNVVNEKGYPCPFKKCTAFWIYISCQTSVKAVIDRMKSLANASEKLANDVVSNLHVEDIVNLVNEEQLNLEMPTNIANLVNETKITVASILIAPFAFLIGNTVCCVLIKWDLPM